MVVKEYAQELLATCIHSAPKLNTIRLVDLLRLLRTRASELLFEQRVNTSLVLLILHYLLALLELSPDSHLAVKAPAATFLCP
jgi:hypothetical protein